MGKRKYWAFFKQETIYEGGKPYIWRLRILETPWFGVFLHRILMSDKDRDLHDHPWSFITFLLMGSYNEYIPSGKRTASSPTFICHRAEDLHRIELIENKPVTTLVIRGRKRRQWGFMTATGWVHNKDYTHA